jgi:hypothetical protein
MDTVGARFWQRRLVGFVEWFTFGWVIVGFGVPLGYTLEARQLVAYGLGLVLLGIALDAVWRRPFAPDVGGEAPSAVVHRLGRVTVNTALSAGIVLLWVCWVARAMASLWLILVIMTYRSRSPSPDARSRICFDRLVQRTRTALRKA